MKLIPTTHMTSRQPSCLEFLPPKSIRANPHNARQHDRRQLDKLKGSIKEFGFNVPVIIDDCNELLCGHARVAVAEELELSKIPVVRTRHLTESSEAGIYDSRQSAPGACQLE